eukprot:NODE_487_length_7781_cov_0.322572.p2 type:complete len:409 gc:universal NODE_487_length_7781_cov_0.322572:6295-7521(+)
MVDSESAEYELPDIHVVNALNIVEIHSAIIEQINSSSFICVHIQSTDAVQLSDSPNSANQLYDNYCLLRRAINQSGVISMALSIGKIDRFQNVNSVIHYQIALCPFTDHNEHPHFLQHMLTKGFNPKEYPFAIRYFPGKPRSDNQLGGTQKHFKYPEAHTAFIKITNAFLRPPPSRLMFVWDGMLTLMTLYRHFHTNLPKSPQELLVDLYDMYGNTVIDTALYANLNGLPPVLMYLAVIHGTSVTAQSASFTQSWPCTTDIYEQQIIQSKNKELRSVGRGTVCEKYIESGYCLLEGACSFSHNIQDIVSGEPLHREDSIQKTWKVPQRFRTWHLEGVWLSCLIKESAHLLYETHLNQLYSYGNYKIHVKPISNVIKSENHDIRMHNLFNTPLLTRAKIENYKGRRSGR